MDSATNIPRRRRNPVRAKVAKPWRLISNKQRRLELMSAAPRDQLNEEEIRQLDSHRSRQAWKRARATEAADKSRGPSTGYPTPPSTLPITDIAVNTPPSTRLSSSPDLDDDQAANSQEHHDGDNDWVLLKASTAGQDNQRENPVALETASIPKPHDSADEQENRIPGTIEKVRAAEGRTGHNVTGHGGSRQPAAGPHQTQLVTPDACARDQGPSTHQRIYDLFATPNPPLAVFASEDTVELDKKRLLQLMLGTQPVPEDGQLHTTSSGRDAGELREHDETLLRQGHVQVLVIDLESVLFFVGIITLLWVVWWLWSR